MTSGSLLFLTAKSSRHPHSEYGARGPILIRSIRGGAEVLLLTFCLNRLSVGIRD